MVGEVTTGSIDGGWGVGSDGTASADEGAPVTVMQEDFVAVKPGDGVRGAFAKGVVGDSRQVRRGVKPVEDLNSIWKQSVGDTPNPGGAIGDDDQSVSQVRRKLPGFGSNQGGEALDGQGIDKIVLVMSLPSRID